MSATTAPTNSNTIYSDRKAVLAKVGKLAEDYAKGAASPAEFLTTIAVAAEEEHITAATNADAKALWDKYANTAETKLKGMALPSNLKVRYSETYTVIKSAAALAKHGGSLAQVFSEARTIMAAATKGELRPGNPWDHMIRLARAQMSEDYVGTQLTENDIKEVLGATTAEEKKELDLLEAALKQLQGIYEGKKGSEGKPQGRPPYQSEELATAMEALNERITHLKVVAINIAKKGGAK